MLCYILEHARGKTSNIRSILCLSVLCIRHILCSPAYRTCERAGGCRRVTPQNPVSWVSKISSAFSIYDKIKP